MPEQTTQIPAQTQQPRRLERGQTYAVGERVIDPITGSQDLVLKTANLTEVVLLEGKVRGGNQTPRYIMVSSYNCSNEGSSAEPERLSRVEAIEGGRMFRAYFRFIDEHGGSS